VYSVGGTPRESIHAAEEAIRNYERPESSVRTEPLVFEVPHGTAPGATLGSELAVQLQQSVGAVVFVDDLRPNVAYELGFFHGRGRTVLLVTNSNIESVWITISDLAGAGLVSLQRQEITVAVHSYLNRLYNELGTVKPWQAPELPVDARNMLAEFARTARIPVILEAGPFGGNMRVDTWGGVMSDLQLNLLPEAKFKVALRASAHGAHYSIYFRVRFPDPNGERRRLWLGLTSRRLTTGFEENERTLPAQAPTGEWRLLSGTFSDLLRAGQVLGARPVEFLEALRIRAGSPTSETAVPIEIGFLDITGIDR
jgi:hypothetical protein